MNEETVSLAIDYGQSGRFIVDLLQKRLLLHHSAPLGLNDARASIREALQNPIDFPPLDQAIVPDDRVIIVMEEDTPLAGVLFEELWRVLEQAGVAPTGVTILSPASWQTRGQLNPLQGLTADLREQITLKKHDPTAEGSCSYLASTAGGERIYLSRELTDADLVITVGVSEFDPVLGIRGTASSLYPGLSDLDALRKAQGQGHDELGPDDLRPLRQMVDEIGWLLGLQLAVSLIPAGRSKIHRVLVGQPDSVLQRSRELLKQNWLVRSEDRAELVIVAVPADAGGHGWNQVAAAIDAGRRLVERNGRIVVLSQLNEEPGPGLQLLRQTRTPSEALKPIQRSHTPDLLAATRIATAAEWANISLLSRLDPNLVDELFLLPLESEDEVRRILDLDDMTAIIEGAQHAFVMAGV